MDVAPDFPWLYHGHHEKQSEDLQFWLAQAEEHGDPILELGCGTGRLLLPLLAAGHRSFGLDRHSGMLAVLRKNFHESPGILVPVFQGDMRQFCLDMRFAQIFLPCNTLATLVEADRLATFLCIHRHLSPGGRFIASLPNPDRLSRLPALGEIELEEDFVHPRTGNPVQVSSGWERKKGNFIITWYYDHLLPHGTVERSTVQNRLDLAPVEKYLHELRRVDMEAISLLGDFDGSAYRKSSPYLIVIAIQAGLSK